MKLPAFLGRFFQQLSGRKRIDTSPPRLYSKFYEQLRSENILIAEAANDVRDRLVTARPSEALAICDQMLALHPGHLLFEGLRLEAEDRERESRLEYIRQVCAELRNIPEVESRVTHSQQALSRYPAESQLVQLLRNATAKRDFIDALVAQAREAEAKGRFVDALERWYIIAECYPVLSGLHEEIRRTEQLLQREASAARIAEFVQDISRMLGAGEYERAVNQCRNALAEFPHDGDLIALYKAAQPKALQAAEIQKLIKVGLAYLDERKVDAALRTFRMAGDLDPTRLQTRHLIGVALLEKSKSILNDDWRAAQMLLEEVAALTPDHPELKTMFSRVAERERDESLRLRRELGEPVADESSLADDILPALEQPAAEGVDTEQTLSHRSRMELILARIGIAARAGWLRVRILGQEIVRHCRSFVYSLKELLPGGFAVRNEQVIAGVLLLSAVGIVWFAYTGTRTRSLPKKIVVNPVLTPVDIAATPDRAEVFIDGKRSGNSTVHTSLAPGSYTVLVASPGYESRSVPLALGSERETLDVKLEPLPLDLHIVTDQRRGRVWLDDESKGNLDAAGITISGVRPGTHELKVRSPEGEVTTTFAYQPGQLPIPVSLPSISSPAILFVGSSNAKSRLECNCAPASFKVDGSDQSLQKGGSEMDLPQGQHEAELSVLGGRKLMIQSGRSPVATVALFWGEQPRASGPSVDTLLREVNTMIGNRQYAAALVKVRQMLSANPEDDRAPVLQKRLERLMAIDP